MRSSAIRCGAACRVGVRWERRLSCAFPPAPPAPPRLHPRPGTPPILPRARWRVSGVPIPSDLPATFLRCWVRRLGLGGRCSTRPHPTPRAFARGAGHDCLPPGHRPQGADPRVASPGKRPDGWRLPTARPRACPSLPAAGPGPVCLIGRPLRPGPAARVSRRLPTPSEPRVLLPIPPLHASRGWLVRFSRPLTSVVSPARLAPRFPSEPLPSALGGGGRRVPGTRARVGGPGG